MDETHDPMATRLVLLRIGWMERYSGIVRGDAISGGGAYIREHGYGHEIFNFRPIAGAVYGYVQPPGGRAGRWSEARINVDRLGGAGRASVSGVLAVWVATAPEGGALVVGWYANATVHRDWQRPPPGSERMFDGVECGYYVATAASDAHLLLPDERVFSVPQKGVGAFGQSNVWYADKGEQHRAFRGDLLQYIDTKCRPASSPDGAAGTYQPDPLQRSRVERIAVEVVAAHFGSLGYAVTSVERDNLGWDLNATTGRRELRLEVKGLSGSRVAVELTPNEYAAMRAHRDSYRLCIVSEALAEPRLSIFAYSLEARRWQDASERVLDVSESVAARCSVAK